MSSASFLPRSALALAPMIFAAAVILFDRDFVFAFPLTALVALCAGVAAYYLSNASERWPTYALVGGVIGWIASVTVLMNLKI